ncbi:response regulator [Novosphingobium mangrovi (ex Hu et al. 2023)]|uniref:Response regulator n=1 Tax=Novosphingobium mangrovi (ex Hu et al. 2023) TaxID=2930094 RepID=A0ABT0AIE5_9SPHN|nr:response regulator [Novosphingobium mangrovi (ex Hu et al. 2023)]MCJ1962968.1 response regulator [Novosphingobium mangrovi (ex Hu et al. 2023)]
MSRVLVVDDDADIRDLLCRYLAEADIESRGAADGDAMWRSIAQSTPDLIILDLMLPGTDGLTLCRALTERCDIPIIMLTARGSLVDRIVGLEMGADDYLPKPFDPRELLARIRVVLRRQRRAQDGPTVREPDYLQFEGWTLDTRRHLLSPPGEDLGPENTQPVANSDYLALRALLRAPFQTLSRDVLAREVYGRERDPSDRAIDMCISRLRQMLGEDARNPRMIRTVRNGGYVLSVDVSASS